MKGIDFPEKNTTLKAPKGMEGEVYELHAHWDREQGIWISRWQASWKERLTILFTGKCWLQVLSFAHPPLCVYASHYPFQRPSRWLKVPVIGRWLKRRQIAKAIKQGLREAAQEVANA